MVKEPKTVFNRAEKRKMMFYKPTKFSNVQYNESGRLMMYLHPTKGFKGNKKAIREFKNKGK